MMLYQIMFNDGQKVNQNGQDGPTALERVSGRIQAGRRAAGDVVAVETLGCRLNQAESESLARRLAAAGYRLTYSSNRADVYILNTCTVTHIADRKSRHLLRLARRRNPRALVIAIGCYPQRAKEELLAMETADIVLGNGEKGALLEVLGERSVGGGGPPQGRWRPARTRSMVKIQEGCNQFCSYCIVPFVRGRERSVPLEEVVREVGERAAEGYREVTLTGTQIGRYEPGLPLLIGRLLMDTGISRLRVSSLRPRDLTPELLSLWNDARLCPHVHVPLQSGSDAVLQRMGRPYSAADYADAAARVRKAVPHVAITTDVMVGFPGETEEDFEASYGFCQSMGFARIHVFPYSERPGTAAAALPCGIPEQEKAARSGRMLELAREASRRYRRQFLGRDMMVLWEGEVERGVWVGLTENYMRAYARSDCPLRNAITAARLAGWRGEDLWAIPLASQRAGEGGGEVVSSDNDVRVQ